ncbi:MAG: ribosome biogenesis GTP-binding protein YihA/YsxC [Gemmatimonadota bacterium]
MRRPPAAEVAQPRLTIRDVAFSGAIAEPGQSPPLSLPQIAIAGRSNVGKSSLINRLVGRKKLARTSKQPGRTQAIHFYRVDDRFALVDLPGYGFARVPVEVRRRWGPLVESYLGSSRALLGVVMLLDSRRGPTDEDDHLLSYLGNLGLPVLFVLTKIDKLARNERRRSQRDLRDRLGVDEDQILATSATTGEGIEELRRSLALLLQGNV